MKVTVPAWVATSTTQTKLLPWPSDLSGKTLGVLDNAKDGATLVLERVCDSLIEGASDVRVVRVRKSITGVAMSDEVREALRGADAVVTGLAD